MKLREFLITFFVHELASPLTALTNTLALCQEDDSFLSEGKDILSESSRILLVRLKFFRALWGIDNDFSSSIGQDFLNTYTSFFEVKGEVRSKIHLGCILIALRILPFGGSIDLSDTRVSFMGKEIRESENFKIILKEDVGNITQENAVFLSFLQQLKKEKKYIKVNMPKENLLILDIVS